MSCLPARRARPRLPRAWRPPQGCRTPCPYLAQDQRSCSPSSTSFLALSSRQPLTLTSAWISSSRRSAPSRSRRSRACCSGSSPLKSAACSRRRARVVVKVEAVVRHVGEQPGYRARPAWARQLTSAPRGCTATLRGAGRAARCDPGEDAEAGRAPRPADLPALGASVRTVSACYAAPSVADAGIATRRSRAMAAITAAEAASRLGDDIRDAAARSSMIRSVSAFLTPPSRYSIPNSRQTSPCKERQASAPSSCSAHHGGHSGGENSVAGTRSGRGHWVRLFDSCQTLKEPIPALELVPRLTSLPIAIEDQEVGDLEAREDGTQLVEVSSCRRPALLLWPAWQPPPSQPGGQGTPRRVPCLPPLRRGRRSRRRAPRSRRGS